jgi:hypothetical protein
MTASETPPVPDGYVVMRWNTLAAILSRHAALDPAAEPDPADLAGDVAAGEVIAALSDGGRTLREWLPDDHAEALLRNLGLIAATGGTNLNGDSNGIR